jgi:uncharacterized membrane protein YbhN (UPF0104 family)/SAM-dependent methyltransferase
LRFDRTWWRWIRLASLLLGVALLFLVAWLRPAQVREVLAAAARFQPGTLAVVLLAASIQVLCQATRFHALLPGRWGVPWITSARLFSAGQLGNVLLPARAGDAFKIAAVRTACRPGTGSLSGSAAAILVADKVIDLAAALLLFAVLSGIHPASPLGWPVAIASAVLLAGGLAAVRGTRRTLGPAAQLGPGTGWAQRVREGCSALAEPRKLAPALTVGTASWLLEALALGWLCQALGHPVGLRESLSALLMINVATAIPVTPGNAGTFEAAGAFALAQWGVPAPAAVAAAAVYHAIQIAAAAGMAAGLRAPPFLTRLGLPGRDLRDFRVRASDKLRAVAFYHRASGHYRASVERGVLRLLRRREQQAVLELARFEAPSAATVIDVGCGDGFYSSAAKRAGKWVHAVDLAPGMVAQVRGRVDRAEVADVEHLDVGRRYDIVLCAGVLDFVADPARAFANLCRLVAPGGRLVLLVPRAGLGGLLYRLEKRRLRVRVNLYRRAWLSRRATEAGLTLTRWFHPLPLNMVLLFEAPTTGAVEVPAGAAIADELPLPQHAGAGAGEAVTYSQGWKSS